MATEALRRKTLLARWGMVLFGVCSVTLAVSQSEAPLAAMFPRFVHTGFFNVPLGISIGGLALAGVLLLCSKLDFGAAGPVYLSEELKASEVEAFRQFAIEWFGETFASTRRLASWLQKRPDCIVVVRCLRTSRLKTTSTLASFYILLPLTRHAMDLYLAGQVDGASFLQEHLPAAGEPVYAVYVAGIAGVDKQANASSLLLLHKSIQAFFKQGGAVALARPTTKRGLGLAEHFGMQPVPGTEIDGHPLYALQAP